MVSDTEVALLQLRVTELEARIKFLYEHLHIDFARPPANNDPAMSPEVQDALRSGNKIGAIKIYRELTNSSLAEAKEAVEQAERFLH